MEAEVNKRFQHKLNFIDTEYYMKPQLELITDKEYLTQYLQGPRGNH
jgi:hypothetical protein